VSQVSLTSSDEGQPRGRLGDLDPRRSVGAQGGDGLVQVRVEQRFHALRELRLGPFDILPRHHTPMITSICQHGPGFGSCPPRLFNPREQHARPRAIGSQSVRLSANSARPARRSNDGRTILDALPAGREPGPDLRFRGAPLRNRTVDLLLTMNTRRVQLPQVMTADQAKREPTPALAGPRQALASTICHSL
jgi:hypothetical protein